MTEPLTFRSFLSKPDLIDFLDLLDFAAVKTSTGRQAVLNFLEENLYYATQPRDPDAFNFYHPKALAHYTWLLGFLQSQYLIDNASGNGLRTVELNRDFNKDLITLATVKNAFIAHYPQ